MVNYGALLISLSAICLLFHPVPLVYFAVVEKDIPSFSFYLWVTVQLIESIINTSIWGGENFASVWQGKVYCDIMVYINDGLLIGVICCGFALSFRSYMVLGTKSFLLLPKWKQQIFYGLICWLSPVIVMVLNYLVIMERYAIVRFDGCFSVHDSDWLNYFIAGFFTCGWSIATIVVSLLTLYEYYKKKFDAADIVRSTNSGISMSRIWRTLLLCLICVLVDLPVTISSIIINNYGNTPNYDYHEVHSNLWYNVVSYYNHDRPYYSRWLIVALSVVINILLGVGENIKQVYLRIFRKVGLGFIIDYIEEKKVLRQIKKSNNDNPSMFTYSAHDPSNSSRDDDMIYANSDLFDYDPEKQVGSIKEFNISQDDQLSELQQAHLKETKFEEHHRHHSSSSDSTIEYLPTDISKTYDYIDSENFKNV